MTIHPEAAMTREQALEEALKPFAKMADDPDFISSPDTEALFTDWNPDMERAKPSEYSATVGDLRKAKAALASTRQEPAPAADAGLVDAANFLDALADEMSKPHPTDRNGEPLIVRAHRCNGYRESAKQLRARAKSGEKGGADD